MQAAKCIKYPSKAQEKEEEGLFIAVTADVDAMHHYRKA